MTNSIAIFLSALILTGLGVDLVFNDGNATLFLVRKFFELIEWVAFWR